MKKWQSFKKRYIFAIVVSLFFLFSVGVVKAEDTICTCKLEVDITGCKFNKSVSFNVPPFTLGAAELTALIDGVPDTDCSATYKTQAKGYIKSDLEIKGCVLIQKVEIPLLGNFSISCNGTGPLANDPAVPPSDPTGDDPSASSNPSESSSAGAKSVAVGDVTTQSTKNAPKVVELVNPITGNPSIQVIIGNVILKLMGILGALALLVFVYGGFKWLAAAGNEEHIKEGTQAMLWAVIGIFIIFGSYAIIKLIYTGLGIETGVTEEKKAGCMCFTEQSKDVELLESEYIDAEICATAVGKDGGLNEGKIISCKFY